QPDAAPVVVISQNCWERRFGGDSGVLGKALRMNNVVFTVVGVIPPTFQGLDPQAVPEAYVPIRQHALLIPNEPRLLNEYGSWVFTSVIRLKAGVSREIARRRLTEIYQMVIAENSAWIRPQDMPTVLKRGVRLLDAGRGVATLRQKFFEPLLVL